MSDQSHSHHHTTDSCKEPEAEPVKSCCHGTEQAVVAEPEHSCSGGGESHHAARDVKPASGAKYWCPMCPGVESDVPGDCVKCGMALERNSSWRPSSRTIYTCPM